MFRRPDRSPRNVLAARRRETLRAVLLLAPALLFLGTCFVYPMIGMLTNSFHDEAASSVFPRTANALRQWDGAALPDDETWAVFMEELQRARESDRAALAGAVRRMNFDEAGFRGLMRKAGRLAPEGATVREALIANDSRWGDPETWGAIKRSTQAVTPFYLLAAVDLAQDRFGDIVSRPREEAIFLGILWRTFKISLVVTLACFALAYPLAHLLAHLPRGTANVLMILVLVPFWTSLLVRTSSWIVLLQKEGVVNDALVSLGVLAEPVQLIYNRTGVYVAMVQILLPFMILPIYNTMIGIPPTYMRAAVSLGAHPLLAFRKVYFPLTVPGISAGGLLVFCLSLGYYITPALVGGPGDQMVAYFIAFYTNQTINWGLASALALVLLLLTVTIVALQRLALGQGRGGGIVDRLSQRKAENTAAALVAESLRAHPRRAALAVVLLLLIVTIIALHVAT